MKPKSTLRSFLLGCSSLLAVSSLHAADGTWIQTLAGPFDWSDAAIGNWSGDIVAGSADSTANFTPNLTAAQVVNLAEARIIGNITFTDSTTSDFNLTISGANTLTLDRTDATKPTIDVTQSGRTLTIASVVAGNVGLLKSGAGTLTLSAVGNNTLSGNIEISAGSLFLGNNTATTLGPSGNFAGNISIASGSTLNVWTSSNQTFSSGIISGAGAVVKAYGGTLTLSGLNTYTGKTSITPQTTAGGSISVSSFDYITSGTYSNHGLGSSLGAPTTPANGTISIGSGTKQASCSLIYTGTGETTDRVIQFNLNGSASHTLTANTTGGGLLKFTSNPLIGGGVSGNVNLTGSGAGEISGNIPNLGSSTGKLIINSSGTGSWTLSGNNIALTKGLTLTAGKLNINHANALGATASTFTIGAATFDNTTSGLITNANNNAIAWNGDSTFTGTNALDLGTGNVTLGGNRAPVVTASTLTIGGVVSGAFGITLGGNGRLVLSNAASTYTGKTVVGNNVGSALTLQVSKLDNLSATSSLGAPTTAANGLIQLGVTSNSSTFDYIGTSASSTNRQVQIGSSAGGSGGAFINNNSVDPAHTLTFSNAAFNVAATGVTSFNRSIRLGGSNTGDNTVSGVIINNVGTTGGLVGLIKQGAGTWKLAGSNTYTGATAINGGTLIITGASQSTSAITFGGGVLGLDTANTVAAASATVDFSGQTVLVTGPTGAASYTLLTAFSINPTAPALAPGSVSGYTLVIDGNSLKLNSTGTPTGFAAWQAANGTAGTRDQDHDNDGVDNGTEHFIYGPVANSGFTALPGVTNTLGVLSVTYTKAAGYTGAYNTDFVVETSATLAGPWTPETLGGTVTITGPNNEFVTYTFPGGPAYSGKNFARLSVTGP